MIIMTPQPKKIVLHARPALPSAFPPTSSTHHPISRSASRSVRGAAQPDDALARQKASLNSHYALTMQRPQDYQRLDGCREFLQPFDSKQALRIPQEKVKSFKEKDLDGQQEHLRRAMKLVVLKLALEQDSCLPVQLVASNKGHLRVLKSSFDDVDFGGFHYTEVLKEPVDEGYESEKNRDCVTFDAQTLICLKMLLRQRDLKPSPNNAQGALDAVAGFAIQMHAIAQESTESDGFYLQQGNEFFPGALCEVTHLVAI